MKEKTVWALNITLFLVAVILLLHFLEVELPSLGKAQYWLDKSEPVCVASFKEQRSWLADIEQCCLGLEQQLFCENYKGEMLGEEVNKRCYTGESSVSYFVNSKAYNYCYQSGYLSYRIF